MRRLFFRFITVCLAAALPVCAAAADVSPAGDAEGRWAGEALLRAADDGYLDDSGQVLRPDEPITGAELIAVLTRVFDTSARADISGVTDVAPDSRYYDAAAKAVAMGIITPSGDMPEGAASSGGTLRLDGAIARSRAFAIIAEAFQLVGAGQDTSVLAQFSDGDKLAGNARRAAAALVTGGYVTGSDGQLHIGDSLTRAELLAILYGIVPNIGTSDTGAAVYTPGGDGGTLLSGVPSPSGGRYPGAVYLGCAAADVSLRGVRADTAVLRCGRIDSLEAEDAAIGRLVIAACDGDITFYPDETSEIGTVVIGPGRGKLVLGGKLTDVEITGSGRTVFLNAPVRTLSISGSDNIVAVSPYADVSSLKILETGTGNFIALEGGLDTCELLGKNTAVAGGGTIRYLTDCADGSRITAGVDNLMVNVNYGLSGVTLELAAPKTVLSGRPLDASVTVTAPFPGKVCRGAWYLDGVYIEGADITPDEPVTTPFRADTPRISGAPAPSVLTFVLSHTGPDGVEHELSASAAVTVEPEPDYTAEEVMQLVTTGYKGDRTLAWAENNDYGPALKEDFVNLKGYSSKTPYLVWVSIAYQRVNIFSGSEGRWKLEKCCIIGSGASGRDTPTGVFAIIGRHTRGWTTKEYTVRPVINFLNSAYGFHSRLFYPGTDKIRDKRIGFPVSHGCIRMYEDDVAWMYDNLENGTTVVVY